MKFSLDRDSFAKILKKVDGVCSTRGSFAILNSCMIEARGDSIIVTGTDLDITLKVVENAHVIEEGIIIVHANRLLNTVQNLASDSTVTVTSEMTQILIEAGNFKGRIPSGDIADFPQIPSFEYNSTITLKASVFKDLIDKTMFSISKDDSRAEFTGADLVISQNGNVEMVSTDGHRLSRASASISVTGEIPAIFETGAIIPRKGLSELAKNLTDGEVTLDVSNGKIIVSCGSMMFCINLIVGQFPPFSKVIPQKLDHKAIVRRDEFMQILKRASFFTAKANTIRITMSPGRLEVSSSDKTSGEMRDFVDAEYEGSGVMAGFNWIYISEILSVLDGDNVSLEIIDMDSPAVIRDTQTDTLDYIVMPMQL